MFNAESAVFISSYRATERKHHVHAPLPICNMTLSILVPIMMPVELLQVEAGLTDLQQAYDQLHKDLAAARGADERRTLEEHVRSTPRSTN